MATKHEKKIAQVESNIKGIKLILKRIAQSYKDSTKHWKSELKAQQELLRKLKK